MSTMPMWDYQVPRTTHMTRDERMRTTMVELVAMSTSWLLLSVTMIDAPTDDKLVAYCTAGGISAAFAAICLWPPTTHRGAMTVFLGNALCAGVFGPMVADVTCQRVGVPLNLRSAIFISGVIGLGASAILVPLAPQIVAWCQSWVSKRLDK